MAIRRRGKATREILLSSAIKLVALQGYAATTIQALLDDARVSRGSLLHQFPTRELLMVATAEEAMSRMLAAVEDELLRHRNLLKGMLDLPNIIWRVQNDLAARAFTEIQLASRWDQSLADGLKVAVAKVNEITSSKVRQVAEQYAIADLPRVLNEVYFLIAATQGLAIGSDLVGDRGFTTASLALLKDRFVESLSLAIQNRQ